MSLDLKLGQIRQPSPAAGYLGWFPAAQAVTDNFLADQSPAKINGSAPAGVWGQIGAANKPGLWANQGWATCGGINNAYGYVRCVPAQFTKWNFAAKDTLLVMWRVKMPYVLATGNAFLAGNGKGSQASNPSATPPTPAGTGIDFQQGTTALATPTQLYVHARYISPLGVETQATQILLKTPVVDGKEHHIAFLLDGLTGYVYIFVDGQLDTKFDNSSTPAGPWIPPGSTLEGIDGNGKQPGWGFGGSDFSQQSCDALVRDMHVLRRPYNSGQVSAVLNGIQTNLPPDIMSRIPAMALLKNKPMPAEWWD